MNKVTFIRQQLAKLAVVDFSDNSEAKIICPYHDDSNPSLGISLINRPGKVSVGGFNCWVCGKRNGGEGYGGWNKLAEKLGLEQWEQKKYENEPENEFATLLQDIREIEKQQALVNYQKPPTEGPWEGSWRGLSGEFLRSVGCEAYWDRRAEEYRLWFPLQDLSQKLVGHIAARGENSDIEDKYKYLNSEGFPALKHWYGLNFEKSPRWVVPVEGPYDMLRFRAHGIPAIAVLGLGQLTDIKILQVLSKGCTRVLLCLDGDKAGRDATPKYAQEFKKFGCEVQDVNLTRYLPDPTDGEAKIDPGSCPEDAIRDIQNFLAQN
jgi:DNA primase